MKNPDGSKATSPWPEWLATGLIGPVVLRPAALVPLQMVK